MYLCVCMYVCVCMCPCSAISEGMSLDALHESSVCAVMVADGYRQELARHCLAVYGTQCASSDTDKDTGGASTASTGSDRMQCDDDRVWKLDIVKVRLLFVVLSYTQYTFQGVAMRFRDPREYKELLGMCCEEHAGHPSPCAVLCTPCPAY